MSRKFKVGDIVKRQGTVIAIDGDNNLTVRPDSGRGPLHWDEQDADLVRRPTPPLPPVGALVVTDGLQVYKLYKHVRGGIFMDVFDTDNTSMRWSVLGQRSDITVYLPQKEQ